MREHQLQGALGHISEGQRVSHRKLEGNAGFPGTAEGPTSRVGNVCSSVKRTMEQNP